MASSLTLDRADPDINAIVSQWEDGQTYTVTLTITQVSSNPTIAKYTVDDVEASEAPEPEEETVPPVQSKPAIEPVEY